MKTAILMCTCSAACPSMEKIDFWELAERIRLTLPQNFVLLHPRLCEQDGEALMEDLLKDDTLYMTLACAENKQAKLLADGFARAGVSMDEQHWLPICMAAKDSDQVFEEVRAAISGLTEATK